MQNEEDKRTFVHRAKGSATRIDLVCDEFEHACRAGQNPRIEEYLSAGTSSDRSDLFRELLAIELEYLVRGGHSVLAQDYDARFSEFRRIIAEQLAELERDQSTVSPNDPTASFSDGLGRDRSTQRSQIAEGAIPFGRFEIGRRIGAGGMGVVFEAFDRDSKKRVAIKLLPRCDGASLYRFKREFRVVSDLSHPNLVVLHELFADGDQWFFTMDLIDGTDFLKFVRGQNSPGFDASIERRLRTSFGQLCDGLQTLHSVGVVHRDIKPSNVMVRDDGQIVILDLGLAIAADPHSWATHSEVEIGGTIAYMAPEQAIEEARPASDWYSVGTLLYQCLTGQLPFRGNALQMLNDKQTLLPLPPSEIAPNVPDDLNALCMALLETDPENRPCYQHVAEYFVRNASHPIPLRRLSRDDEERLFIGRESQLRQLRDAYERMKSGVAGLILIRGNSGDGKTALVERFLDLAYCEDDQTLILGGRCYERESVPFKALDSMLDSLTRVLSKMSPAEIAGVLPRFLSALVRVFPVLQRVDTIADRFDSSTEPPDRHELRRRAFGALRELLARLADTRPIILFIDDLQWGDLDSALLLNELRRAPDEPVLLIVGCYRDEHSVESPCVVHLLESGNESDAANAGPQVIDLQKLSLEESRELALSLLESSDAEAKERALAIAREADGNPFFVRELAVFGSEDSELEGAPLDEVISSRAAGLSDSARELLKVASVSGYPTPLKVLYEAVGNGQVALDELRVGRFVKTTGPRRDDRLELYHDRIRESIVNRLSSDQLEEYHRRLATAFSSMDRENFEAIARHAEGSGQATLAAENYEKAAKLAVQKLAFDHAATLLGKVLDLSPAIGVSPECEIRLMLAEALVNGGRGVNAAKEFEKLASLSPDEQAMEYTRRAAVQLLISGHIDEGIEVLQQVLAPLHLSFPRNRLHTVASITRTDVQLHLNLSRYNPIRSKRRIRECEKRADACRAATMGLIMVDPFVVMHFQGRQLLYAMRSGDKQRIASALEVQIGRVALDGRNAWTKACGYFDRAREMVDFENDPYFFSSLHLWKGAAAWLTGQWDECRSLSRIAIDTMQNQCQGVWWELANAQTFYLASLAWLGDLTEHARMLPAIVRGAEQRGDLFTASTLPLLTYHYVSHLSADSPERAQDELDVSLAEWTQRGFHLQHFWHTYGSAEVALYRGDPDNAFQIVERDWGLLRRSMLLSIQTIRIFAYYLRGRCALAAHLNQPDQSKRHVALQAIRKLHRTRRTWASACADSIRAGLDASDGKRLDSIERMSEAVRKFEECEMRIHAASASIAWGSLKGADAASRLIDEADAKLRVAGIVDTNRFSSIHCPVIRHLHQ